MVRASALAVCERICNAARSYLAARRKVGSLRQAIFDNLYRAMRETLNVPEDDQFMTIREHDAANFRYGASCFGIARSDDVVFIQITMFNIRTLEQKKALFRRAAPRRTLASFPFLSLVDFMGFALRGHAIASSLGDRANRRLRSLHRNTA